MYLDFKLFLKPVGRANSTRGDSLRASPSTVCEERLGKSMDVISEPFLKLIGRANSTQGQSDVTIAICDSTPHVASNLREHEPSQKAQYCELFYSKLALRI